jgi:hypothetical protein
MRVDDRYQGETEGLNPLQKRMIRAKVKRELAKKASGEPASDEEEPKERNKK